MSVFDFGRGFPRSPQEPVRISDIRRITMNAEDARKFTESIRTKIATACDSRSGIEIVANPHMERGTIAFCDRHGNLLGVQRFKVVTAD